MISKQRRDTLIGLGFLAPNILGFLTFTLGPLVFSLFLAFTNWDLRLHNMFKEEELQIVFFENFIRLFKDPDFWKYLGNTLFLMMGIPFAIARPKTCLSGKEFVQQQRSCAQRRRSSLGG